MSAVFKDGVKMATLTGRIGRLSITTIRNVQLYSPASHHVSASVAQSRLAEKVTVKPTSEIPGPPRFPFIGSVFPLAVYRGLDKKKTHKFWEMMEDRYGSIVRLSLPKMPILVAVTNPEDCEVLVRHTTENPMRPPLDYLRKVRLEAVDDYFEQKTGLITENGEEWKRVRSRVQTPMMKPKNVSLYLKEMDQVTLEFVDRITMLQKEHGEMPADFQVELYKWALESVGLVALNRRLGCLDPDISEDSEPMKLIHNANMIFEAMNEIEIEMNSMYSSKKEAYNTLKRCHDEFLRIADERIQQTEAEVKAKKSSNPESELTLMETLLLTPGLSRKDVVTLIIDMLVAGIDTTSHTLGFTLYLLARNPDCQAKLQEEVDRVMGDHQGPLTTKHLAQMSYLKAVVKESLRIFPLTIGKARILDKDIVLSGYLVPKGCVVMAVNMLMGHNEQLFPSASEFIPERWLRNKPLGPIHPYASLPFGTGPRMCLGRRIAEQEIYTFLTRVMHRFSVDYKYEDIDIVSRLVFVPSEPLRFSFTERK